MSEEFDPVKFKKSLGALHPKGLSEYTEKLANELFVQTAHLATLEKLLKLTRRKLRLIKNEKTRRYVGSLREPTPTVKEGFVRYKLGVLVRKKAQLDKQYDWILLNSRLRPLMKPAIFIKYRGLKASDLRELVLVDEDEITIPYYGTVRTTSIHVALELLRFGGRLDRITNGVRKPITKLNSVWVARKDVEE